MEVVVGEEAALFLAALFLQGNPFFRHPPKNAAGRVNTESPTWTEWRLLGLLVASSHPLSRAIEGTAGDPGRGASSVRS